MKNVERGCIYRLTCEASGRSYIGQHNTLTPETRRWRAHINAALRGEDSFLQRAIRKYGAKSLWLK